MRGFWRGNIQWRWLIGGLLLAGVTGAWSHEPWNALLDPAAGDDSVLQNPREVTTFFPPDRDQRPDWVDVLRRGLIKPRETLRGAPRGADPMGPVPTQPILFTNTREMPYVVFPHAPHAEWLACSNCHDALFPRQATGKGKGMTAILAGEHCGACHGRVAFSPYGSCYRCHSLPNPNGVISLVAEMPTFESTADKGDTANEGRRRRSAKPAMPGGFAPVRR